MSKTIKELEEENKALKKALNDIVDMYVANRGNPSSEFISCITPKSNFEMTALQRQKCKVWKVFDAARILLGE